MKKLLWVGDSPACQSGFGKASKEILDVLRYHFHVTVLGINANGDPHTLPYDIFLAMPGGDTGGVGRIVWMCDMIQPDAIIIQQDGWNIPPYIQQLRLKKPDGTFAWPEHAKIPVMLAVAVDGKNFRGKWLDGAAHTIFWTAFAQDEARAGRFTGDSTVIPLGVDLEIFKPMDKVEARRKVGFGPEQDEMFIVGNVNRNQPRKRWDLTLRYFANWINEFNIDDALLYLHVAPTGDLGIDVKQLADYYGIVGKIALSTPATFYGNTEEYMNWAFNTFDVQISTTQGEGFGLTTLEGMACGVPQIVPDWAALGEWARPAAQLIKCSTTGMNNVVPTLNIIGGIPDEADFIQALQSLYSSPLRRTRASEAGLRLVQDPKFRWQNIGEAWVKAIEGIFPPLEETTEEIWADLGRPEEEGHPV